MKRNKIFAGLIFSIISLGMLLVTCSLAGDMDDLRAKAGGGTFTLTVNDISNLESQLSAQKGGTSPAKPGKLILEEPFDLGNMADPSGNWQKMLNILGTAGKYVELDLSACAMTGTVGNIFDPRPLLSTGKDRIVSIVLPDIAPGIEPGMNNSVSAFLHFSNLKTASGSNITDIGNFAFYSRAGLTSVNFPETIGIGDSAFYGCELLSDIDFQKTENIGSYAFNGCSKLTNVYLPAAEYILGYAFGYSGVTSIVMPAVKSIYSHAFRGCKNLVSVTFPKSANIGINPFIGCPSLRAINLQGSGTTIDIFDTSEPALYSGTPYTDATLISWPAASGNKLDATIIKIAPAALQENTNRLKIYFDRVEEVGTYAFTGCTGLWDVTLPKAEKISDFSFQDCTDLEKITIPSVSFIGLYAFARTGSVDLEITMGDISPQVDVIIFYNVTEPKTVTVKVPSGATGYGTVPATYSGTDTTPGWGNQFRGLGYDDSGMVNPNITLHIVEE